MSKTFTADDVPDLAAAQDLLIDFKRFVLDRFGTYTRSTAVVDQRGRQVEPITDPTAATNAGYGQWRVNINAVAQAIDGGPVIVEHYMADDRGPGTLNHVVEVPLDFLFGGTDADPEYEEYLRLKAIYEPTQG